MQPERRSSERVDVFLIVEFRPFGKETEYTQGVTENISAKGLSFDSQNHQLDPENLSKLNLNIRKENSPYLFPEKYYGKGNHGTNVLPV